MSFWCFEKVFVIKVLEDVLYVYEKIYIRGYKIFDEVRGGGLALPHPRCIFPRLVCFFFRQKEHCLKSITYRATLSRHYRH